MKTRTRPTCPACARRFDAARPARGGWRFFEPCDACDPSSRANREKAERAKRAKESEGQVIEPTPSPDPDAEKARGLIAPARDCRTERCGCGTLVTFDRLRGLGQFRKATLTLPGEPADSYRATGAVSLRPDVDPATFPTLSDVPIHDLLCASCCISQVVSDAADGRRPNEVWTVEASQASRAIGRR
jgi:hypothetical protein